MASLTKFKFYENSIEANYDEWLKFAKEENAKRVVAIPDVERISALEQAIMEIGEVLGNG